jgi:hypothetical protein
VPANYRGPEWQWMQEALVRLAAQADSRTPDSPLAGPLTMESFRTRL